MKKTDLYKNLGLKINGQMKQAGAPDRFGKGATGENDKNNAKKRLHPLFSAMLKDQNKE